MAVDPAPRTGPRTGTCAAVRSRVSAQFCPDFVAIRLCLETNPRIRARRAPLGDHTHLITNTAESGEIPKLEATNWQVPGLNNFRQNVQPEGEFSAPDLIVDLRLQCAPEAYGLVGRVRNIGEASTPAGVPVYFFEGDPDNGGTLLGMTATTKVLYPAEAEEVVVLLADPPPGLRSFWLAARSGRGRCRRS